MLPRSRRAWDAMVGRGRGDGDATGARRPAPALRRVRRGPAGMTAMEEELQRLSDESAVKDVVLRYARAIDRMDLELLRDCYHPGAIDDHGGPFLGTIEEFIPWFEAQMGG